LGRLVRGVTKHAEAPDAPRPNDMGADERLDSVARALGSEDASARMLALEVILGFSEERAAGLLAAAIHDPDRAVSRAAMAAAGRMRAQRAVSSLILALGNPDAELRADAVKAFEQITGRAVAPSDVDDPDARRSTIGALQTWWKQERFERLAAGFGLDPRSVR
jgi:HEAT repeat protein